MRTARIHQHQLAVASLRNSHERCRGLGSAEPTARAGIDVKAYRAIRCKGDRWIERGRISASKNVFQVGPLLSPTADRLLFAQAQGARSGELFLLDLVEKPDARWPPCARRELSRH